ncbi:MAG: chorismate synthase [Armatimonadota bacterium]
MRSALELTTAGESHGPCVTAILDGVPSGLSLTTDDVNRDLARRQIGYGRGGRMKIESDRVQFTGGVRHGQTLGSPVCMVIENRDWENWREEMGAERPGEGWESERRVSVPRPGHADLAGLARYGHRDMRNVLERASARETAARVAAGAVCRALLRELGASVRSRTVEIGGVRDEDFAGTEVQWQAAEASDLRCADEATAERMRAVIDEAKAAGDSLGGEVEIVAEGIPPGLGSHVAWDTRLDGRIAGAMLGIPAIKACAIGAGFEAGRRPGSEYHDPIVLSSNQGWPFERPTNNAGGIEGGITNGEPVVVRMVMKPIPTLTRPLASVDLKTGEATEAHAERSDVCAVPAAGVVGEAMLALVLASAALEFFGGGTMDAVKAAYDAHMRRLSTILSGENGSR